MMRPSFLKYHFLLLATTVSFGHGFDRGSCFQTAIYMLDNQTLSPTSEFFYRDPAGGLPYNGFDNMTLTLQGCNAICGSERTWYNNIGPRISIWLIPIFLLLANVELSPLDKRSFLGILHLLGDPIDSMWSLLHKLDVWDRCSRLVAARWSNACPSCQHIVATVLAGHEEVQGPRIKSADYLEGLLEHSSLVTDFNEWRRAAVRLADGRTDEIGRATFALLIYFLQLTAAFVPEVGGEPSGPPGGRIATGVLLSWLVPLIIMSNAIGNLSSRRTAHDILMELAAKSGDDAFDVSSQGSDFLPTFPSIARSCSADYFSALTWSGGIYTYRPWKLRYVTPTGHRHLYTLLLFILAALPMLIGLIGGVLILWYQLPVGPNCRHVWLVGIALLWSCSTFITLATYRSSFTTGRYHWHLTLIKDACVAVPSLLIMFLSAVGLFNFCWCWSGPFHYSGIGRVPLLESVYMRNARSIYPTIVGTTLLLEIFVLAVLAFVWRRGLRLLRWRDKTRQQEWNRVMRNDLCDCAHNNFHRLQQGTGSQGSLLKSGVRMIC